MGLKIVPSSEALIPAVKDLNARLAAGGTRWRFFDMVTPKWLPPAPGASAWREYYLLVDEETGLVRGGYALKFEQFQLGGKMVELVTRQGPVAESAVDKSLKGLGSMMIGETLKRFPLQFGWGATSMGLPLAAKSPMLLHIRNVSAFLKRAPIVSARPRIAGLAKAAAGTGLGPAGIKAAQAALGRMPPRPARFTATEEPDFGAWADEVWQGAKDAYHLIALRDRPTLNRAMPRDDYPEAVPLKVDVDGETVGWAALRDRRLEGDALFGDLRVGSVIDALALPGHEATVAAASRQALARRGVDMIGTCFFHRSWIAAFRSAGFLSIPDRRCVAFTPELSDAAGGVDKLVQGTHLSLMDHDGPHLF